MMEATSKPGVQAYYPTALRLTGASNIIRQGTARFYAALSALLILLFYLFPIRTGSRIYSSSHSSFRDITNTTLGFEKIFVLNLASRHDKRDAISMSASVSDIDFEWLDGVDGSLMSPKSKPPKMEAALQNDNNTLGCWRAHMNAMQYIVKNRIQSALIMEDDADWDVNVRSQLSEFARGARFVQGAEHETSDSPYGNDWDVLWLGHCGISNVYEDSRWWVARDDPTAIPPELYTWGHGPNLSPPALSGRHNRYVYQAGGGRCLYAYAVSLRGARLFLNTESMALETALPADRGMARLCHVQRFGAKCIGPYPSIFGSHQAAGPMSKDSDRLAVADNWRKVGTTLHVAFSTRLNIESMIGQRGVSPKVLTSQWPNNTMVPEYAGDLRLPEGEGVLVGKEEFKEYYLPPQIVSW